MVIYDMGFMDNSTNFFQIIEGVNTISGGLFMPTILLIITALVFLALKMAGNDADDSVLVSAFAGSTLSVLFFIAGLVGVEIFIIPVVALLAGIFMKVINN